MPHNFCINQFSFTELYLMETLERDGRWKKYDGDKAGIVIGAITIEDDDNNKRKYNSSKRLRPQKYDRIREKGKVD